MQGKYIIGFNIMQSKFVWNMWDKVYFNNKGIGKMPGRDLGKWTYLIEAENDYVKIGTTTAPETRFRSIDNIVPLALKPILLIDSAVVSEPELHRLFSKQRYKGEWFCKDDLLTSLCKDPDNSIKYLL